MESGRKSCEYNILDKGYLLHEVFPGAEARRDSYPVGCKVVYNNTLMTVGGYRCFDILLKDQFGNYAAVIEKDDPLPKRIED